MSKGMVAAACDGKIKDFEAAFNAAMATKVIAAVDSVKRDIGASIEIDGEVDSDGDK